MMKHQFVFVILCIVMIFTACSQNKGVNLSTQDTTESITIPATEVIEIEEEIDIYSDYTLAGYVFEEIYDGENYKVHGYNQGEQMLDIIVDEADLNDERPMAINPQYRKGEEEITDEDLKLEMSEVIKLYKFSDYDGIPETTAMLETAALADEQKYVTIPRFYNLYQKEAEALFDDHNLKCTVEYSPTNNRQGIVYSVVFHGYYDDDNFYITPESTVALKVSLGQSVPDNAANVTADSGKMVYLTFDDGPTKNNTYRVLEILQKYDIKATFFLVGNPAKYYTEQVKSVYDAGHVIGCHSSTHEYNEIYSSADAFTEDIQTWEKTIYDITGELGYKIYRFPGGSTQARGNYETYCEILQSLQNAKYTAFDWTMSNNDVWSRHRSGDLTPDEYVKASFLEQLNKLERWSVSPIVLMHETYDCTVNMLEWAIDILIERGYSFGTLDKLEGNRLL